MVPMIRAAFILALALRFGAAHAGPTYYEKFDEYVGYGWPPEEIVAGLTRWFGWNFELDTFNEETYVRLVLRNPDLSIYRLETIGKVPRVEN